jgi:polysaccharide export outer membrane protein
MNWKLTLALGLSAAWTITAQPLVPTSQPLPPAAPKPVSTAVRPDVNYTLGPDDVISVQVRDLEEIGKQPVRIDAYGEIHLPVAGGIKAAGLTPRELQAEIARRVAHVVRSPEVVVSLQEQRSQPVSVIGAVRAPGVFQIQGGKTLVEVLSLAGGLKEDAGTTLKITRRVDRGPLPLKNVVKDPTGQFQVGEISVQSVLNASNPAENLYVEANDVISGPDAQLVYVMGYVKKPGGFVIRDQEHITALMALSLAEGSAPTAAPKHSRILRRQAGAANRQEIPVDLSKMLTGQAPDVPMEPGDILVVPNSVPKNAALRTIESAIQIGTGLVIWRR